jgi:hypothetical protein
MMRRPHIRLLLALLALATSCAAGCTTGSLVSKQSVPGKYAITYPFGFETLVLNQDGTFVQHVEVKGEPHATVKGTWSFDAAEASVNLRGWIPVVDGHGKIEPRFRPVRDVTSLGVERLWLQVVLQSGATYPYYKQ